MPAALKFKNNIFLYILFFQIIVLFLIIFITYIKNSENILSCMYGGLSSIISYIPFSIFFKKNNIKKIIRNFYLILLTKIFLLCFSIILFFKIGIDNPFYYFVSFAITQFSFWVGCFLYIFLHGDIILYERK